MMIVTPKKETYAQCGKILPIIYEIDELRREWLRERLRPYSTFLWLSIRLTMELTFYGGEVFSDRYLSGR